MSSCTGDSSAFNMFQAGARRHERAQGGRIINVASVNRQKGAFGQTNYAAAKAGVILNGRFNVSCRDVREFALPVLRHRIFPNFTAASEGVTADEIVRRIVAAVREPDY